MQVDPAKPSDDNSRVSSRPEPDAAPTDWPRSILVQGVGGIGGIVSGRLIQAGYNVLCVCGNQRIADALNAHGMRLKTFSGSTTVSLRRPALVSLPLTGDGSGETFDMIIVATPPAGLEKALQMSARALSPSGRVLCLQNGLPESRATQFIPHNQVLGCVLSWGASMPEPGCYEQTTQGGIQLGYPDRPLDALARSVGKVMEHVAPVRLQEDLQGVRWSKLAVSAAITTLGAVGGQRLGVLLRHRFVRRLAMEVFTEVLEVARQKGIQPAPLNGVFALEQFTVSQADRHARLGSPTLFMKHGFLLALGMKYRRMRSSMLYAMERGRTHGAEYLNGEVVAAGKLVGVNTPVNHALLAMINRIAQGEARPGVETLRSLYESLKPALILSQTQGDK